MIVDAMDEPTSLEELCVVDEMTLHFWPGGLSGALIAPKDSLRALQQAIRRAQLVADVPEDLREGYARVRKTFLYGLVEYDLFTVAGDLSYLMLEAALRVRFLAHYDGKVPLSKRGEVFMLDAQTFDDVRKARFRRCRLVVNGRLRVVPIGMEELLGWARQEGLLVGQRSAAGDESIAKLRHYVAHPTGFHRYGPPDAARTIVDIAEYINRLWGQATPGGRVFPAPIERNPRIVARYDDGSSFVEFPRIDAVPQFEDDADRQATFAVYLATCDEELCDVFDGLNFRHRPGVQRTQYPCELLWGPGPWRDLLPELPRLEDPALRDQVDHLDRIFVIRLDGDEVDDPRSPVDFESCEVAEGSWVIVRADYPGDALRHARTHREDEAPSAGWCSECMVTELGRFENRAEVEELLNRFP